MRTKLTAAISAAISICLLLTGLAPAVFAAGDTAAPYRAVPGVTAEEIEAIEAVKAAREYLVYGATLSTEAYELPDGGLAGYAVELSDFLTELFGIEFRLLMTDPEGLAEGLASGRIDVTGEFGSEDAEAAEYALSMPVAERMLRIYTRNDAEAIRSEMDINGMRVGFIEGAKTMRSIDKKARPISYTGVEVAGYAEGAELLLSGEIDAFVADSVDDPHFEGYGDIRSAVFFPMVFWPVSVAARDDALRPFLGVIDKRLAAGGRDELHETYIECDFEYARHKLDRLLTREEREYIAERGASGLPVIVAYEHDNYPVNFYNDKEGEYQGIALDVLYEIGRLTGLDFVPAATKDTDWPVLYDGLLSGEIQMAAQLLKSEDREGSFIWSELPYARTSYALMSRREFPALFPYQVTWVSVGSMRNSGKTDIYRALFPDNDNLMLYETQNECLDALERGEIDLYMASEYNLLTQTNYREKTGFKINVTLDLPMDSHFGFPIGEGVLRSIIDKAQRFVKTEEIEKSWTGRSFDYTKKMSEERTLYLMIFVVVIFLAMILVVFILIKNVRLGKVLQKIATHDAMTNCMNRRYFMEQAPVQIERSQRLGKECYVAIYDLDHFKSVNDTYGHLAGDGVLTEVAQRVKRVIRPYDLLGRYGGEEFTILMCDITRENVILAMERVRRAVCEAPVLFDGKEIPITSSFGVSYVDAKRDFMAALNAADEALYQAKEGGRNRVVLSEAEA